VDRLRQAGRGFDVDALHHAVAADVGVDDGFDAVFLEFFRQVDHVVVGELGPAVDGDLAVPGVQADDDVAGKFRTHVAHEVRRGDRFGADDDVVHADVEIFLDGVLIADAAADLDFRLGTRLGDGADRLGVTRLSGHRAVEIDQMQAPRARIHPAARHRHRIVGKYRVVLHAPLPQAHALAVLQIDCRYEQHLA